MSDEFLMFIAVVLLLTAIVYSFFTSALLVL